MRLAIISDTHGFHDQVRVPPCDVLIHCGDCTNDPGQKSLRDFAVWMERQPAKHKILIAGNHDWALEKWPDLAVSLLNEYSPSVTYLLDSGCEIDGVRFWGSPYQPEFYDWAFNLPRGPELKRHWDMIPVDTDVLITHGPPHGILDVSGFRDGKDPHVGCCDLRDAVARIEPKLHCFGHIHHSYGKDMVGNTYFVNASICNERYIAVNLPITYDLE